MKIAICDDELVIREELKVRLVKIFNELNTVCSIDLYEDFKSFFGLNHEYDLVMLDYNIPGENGIDFAKRLRSENDKIFIVFLTAYPEHVFESFSLNTFRYLVKPVSEESLTEAVNSFIRLYQTDRKIVVTSYDKNYCIDSDEIMYIEADGKYCTVRTTASSVRSYKGISEYEAEINNSRFFRTHRSYILNMKYVSSFNRKEITLTNGERVAISSKRYEEFEKSYFGYLKYKN